MQRCLRRVQHTTCPDALRGPLPKRLSLRLSTSRLLDESATRPPERSDAQAPSLAHRAKSSVRERIQTNRQHIQGDTRGRDHEGVETSPLFRTVNPTVYDKVETDRGLYRNVARGSGQEEASGAKQRHTRARYTPVEHLRSRTSKDAFSGDPAPSSHESTIVSPLDKHQDDIVGSMVSEAWFEAPADVSDGKSEDAAMKEPLFLDMLDQASVLSSSPRSHKHATSQPHVSKVDESLTRARRMRKDIKSKVDEAPASVQGPRGRTSYARIRLRPSSGTHSFNLEYKLYPRPQWHSCRHEARLRSRMKRLVLRREVTTRYKNRLRGRDQLGHPRDGSGDPVKDPYDLLRVEPGELSTFWTRWIAHIRAVDTCDVEYSTLSLPSLHPAAETWADVILNSGKQTTIASIHGRMSPGCSIVRMLEHVAIWLLQAKRLAEIEILLTRTHKRSGSRRHGRVSLLRHERQTDALPRYMVEDMVKFLIDAAMDSDVPASHAHSIAIFIAELSRKRSGQQVLTSGTYQDRILSKLEIDRLADVLRLWDGAAIVTDGNARVHVIERLAQAGLVEDAAHHWHILLAGSARFVEMVTIQSVCVTILRAVRSARATEVNTLDIVTAMVEAGVPLNVQICTVVMHGAVEIRDVTTAFEVFDMLKRSNLRPTEHIYGMLAKACKADLARPELLARLIREAIEDKVLLVSPIVATDVLHCIYKQHSKDGRNDVFELVMGAFVSMFDASPLIKLGLASDQFSGMSNERMQPSLIDLRNVIHAFLFEQNGPENATISHKWLLYQRLRRLAQTAEEPFTNIFQEDYLSNAFVAFFCRDSSSMRYALEVTNDMRIDHQDWSSRTTAMRSDVGSTLR